jgi:hypothetical protein
MIYAFTGFVKSSIIRNNIVFTQDPNTFFNSTGNNITNNLFTRGAIDFVTNTNSGNYIGILQTNIFVNQSGSTIDYTHDYHLKNPTTYLGTDNTQVGIYGGTTPFKDRGLPSNPQVLKKSVATETDASGNLKINFTVKAQDN